MKRRYRLAILLLLFLLLTGCVLNKPSPAPRIYLITIDNLDEFWVNIDAGCRKALEEEDQVIYRWLAPDEKDTDKQIAFIRQAIQEKADAILLAANDPDALVEVLEEADNAGIKLVYVDTPANFPAVQTLATDNLAAGRTAGRQMREALLDKGVTSGFIGIVSTNAATGSTLDREDGFRSAFEGTGFTLLDTRYCGGDPELAAQYTQELLAVGCEGIFGTNEGSTLGVGMGINGLHPAAVGIGFDRSPAIEREIADGSLYCTLVQSPEVMGYSGFKAAVAALRGVPAGAGIVDTGVWVLNKSTLSSS